MARPQPRVVAIGDAIVDLVTPPMPPVPEVDFQGEVSRFDRIPGGNATNFALQMASLGARMTFIGCESSIAILVDEEAGDARSRARDIWQRLGMSGDAAGTNGIARQVLLYGLAIAA